jgi:hypothetical protein
VDGEEAPESRSLATMPAELRCKRQVQRRTSKARCRFHTANEHAREKALQASRLETAGYSPRPALHCSKESSRSAPYALRRKRTSRAPLQFRRTTHSTLLRVDSRPCFRAIHEVFAPIAPHGQRPRSERREMAESPPVRAVDGTHRSQVRQRHLESRCGIASAATHSVRVRPKICAGRSSTLPVARACETISPAPICPCLGCLG